MSVVTSVMLICSIGDAEDNIASINAWLAGHDERRGYYELKEVSEGGGGSKVPQFEAWCGGFNYFGHLEDEFAAFVLGLEWYAEENLVLIMEPENGESRVFRPKRHAVVSVIEPPAPAQVRRVGPAPIFPDSWGKPRA
jgi:hypothetical protein